MTITFGGKKNASANSNVKLSVTKSVCCVMRWLSCVTIASQSTIDALTNHSHLVGDQTNLLRNPYNEKLVPISIQLVYVSQHCARNNVPFPWASEVVSERLYSQKISLISQWTLASCHLRCETYVQINLHSSDMFLNATEVGKLIRAGSQGDIHKKSCEMSRLV